MDIKPQQPISDDQELAKVLAGITAGADGAAPVSLADDLEKEAADPKEDDKAKKDDASAPATDTPAAGTADDAAAATSPIDKIESTVATEEPIFTASAPAAPVMDSGLEAIKNNALNELRPLVDKLNLSAEEKFDTYLLIIRSTDDASLVAPAFEAARAIADETGKAQALFEIVKEIDYLSNPQKPAATA